jgi:nucleotide-binding universal stress UspA family protein
MGGNTMYQKILVPLDGSELAECVLPHVEALAGGHAGADVTLLYVVSPLDAPMVSAAYKKKIETDARAAAHSYVKKLATKPGLKGRSSVKVLFGRPAETIISFAAKNKFELIVMATHGRSGIGQWFYGSVTEKVLQGSKIPLWLVKATACKMDYGHRKLRVLVPLDGSRLAESVLPQVKELTKQLPHNKLDIVLTRVCEIFAPPISYPPPMSLSWDEYLKYETTRCKEICRSYLAGVREKLAKSKVTARTAVPEGNPAEELIEYVARNSVDLIVMSTHGRTGINKWAFGSIAEKVLKGAGCPILLVRTK